MMNHAQKRQLLELLDIAGDDPPVVQAKQHIQSLESDGPCTECFNFESDSHMCHWWSEKGKAPATVPVEHLPLGCEAWVVVPF